MREMALTADQVATAMEHGARVHDDIARRDPQAREEATRLRRLAAAERASAEALLDGKMPPEEVRQVIRDRGRDTDEQDGT